MDDVIERRIHEQFGPANLGRLHEHDIGRQALRRKLIHNLHKIRRPLVSPLPMLGTGQLRQNARFFSPLRNCYVGRRQKSGQETRSHMFDVGFQNRVLLKLDRNLCFHVIRHTNLSCSFEIMSRNESITFFRTTSPITFSTWPMLKAFRTTSAVNPEPISAFSSGAITAEATFK